MSSRQVSLHGEFAQLTATLLAYRLGPRPMPRPLSRRAWCRFARQAAEGVALGAEANKAVARRALERVWSSPSTVPAEEVYAPEFVSHQHSHPTVTDIRGIEELKSFVREFQVAFPDFVDTVERQIAEGELVMTQFTSAGTQQGELMGIPPTGERVEWMGIELARVVGGKIAENWVSWDMYGMLQQLGAIPPRS